MKKIKAKEPIRLRQRLMASGVTSLYLDVYYNGKRIDNYTVTAAANAPFTASVQADGTLLLLKTGRGHAQFTISYQGQSADFGLFVS